MSETGWGEFEVQIKIHFVDSAERPVNAYHLLKLFNTDPRVINGELPHAHEYYDEVVSSAKPSIVPTPHPVSDASRYSMSHRLV